jgi:hypothetical protein
MLVNAGVLADTAGGGPFSGAENITAAIVFDGSTQYLERTPGGADTNLKEVTFGGWYRRSKVHLSTPGADLVLFGADVGAGDFTHFRLLTSTTPFNTLQLVGNSSAPLVDYDTVYLRDADWFHLVVSIDTNQAVAADRVAVYLNGVAITQSGTATYPVLDSSMKFCDGNTQQINHFGYANNEYFNGKMAQCFCISEKSIQKGDFAITDFGDSTTVGTNGAVWTGKSDANIVTLVGTGGSNGSFMLGSGIAAGTDASTHGNNFTPTGTPTSSEDSPTDPHTIWSALSRGTSASTHNDATAGGETIAVNKTEVLSLAVMPGQKVVVEVVLDALNGGAGTIFGICNALYNISAELCYNSPGSTTGGLAYGYFNSDGDKADGPSASGNQALYGNSYTDGDRIQIILDNENGNLFFAKNGTLQNSATSGEIEAGTGTNAAFSGLDTNQVWRIAVGNWSAVDSTVSVVGHVDDATDTVYDGFSYLSISAMPAPVVQGTDVFNAILYTGTNTTLGGGGQSQTGMGFQPDHVTVKARSASRSWQTIDSSRGPQETWYWDAVSAEITETEGLDSFDADGFTHGNDNGIGNSDTHVAYGWKLNEGSTASNTDGDITTTVQAEENGCFSIAQYTGNATANQDIGHGLGVNVAAAIVKNMTDGVSSMVWFNQMAGEYLRLSGTDARASGHFDGTTDTSLFRIESTSNVNGSGDDMVAYFFGLVAGVVVAGEYAGNGSADGPFIFTGFTPRFILFKSHNTASWIVMDTARDPSNEADIHVAPDVPTAEASGTFDVDICAQGFKIRNTNSGMNTSGTRYSFLAIADVAGGSGLPPPPGR